MKMTLDSFCDFVPSRISEGQDYYFSGAITSIEESQPGEWIAVVEGTDDYYVSGKVELLRRLGRNTEAEDTIDVCRRLSIVERGSMEYYYRLKKWLLHPDSAVSFRI